MADSFVLLNDGSSFLLLNDGSKVILNGEEEPTGSGGGGIFARMRTKYRRHPPQTLVESSDFEKMIQVKPVLIRTNELSLKVMPLLRQYVVRLITARPFTTTDEAIRISLNIKKEKHVHLASFICKLNDLLWDHNEEHFLSARATVQDYSHFEIKGRTHDGINIIRKAMALSKVRSFKFRESSQNWESADTLSDLEQRIKVLDDRIDTLQREVDPREKVFDHPSSFIGTVTYTPESNTMEIDFQGRGVYGFCNVPERIFVGFEAAPSKGAYFGRSIKGQFSC